jgi:amidophosphoribosyltransferase
LINTWEIQQYLGKGPFLHPFNTADSGLLLAVFARALQALTGEQPKTIDPNHVFTALKEIYAQCKGSFACLAMLAKGAVLGFRDANGIRPLVYGERVNPDGTTDYMFSSESVALTKLSYTNIKDVLPGMFFRIYVCLITNLLLGQAVLIQPVDAHRKTARVIVRQVVPRLTYTPDIFEYVYLARPESVMDGISVHLSRKNMGKALAATIKSQLGPDVTSKLDAVIPVPETAQTSALSASQKLNVPYSHGIVKNRYIFRTFIMPEQAMRRQGVLRKLNAVREEFEDKDVVLVDDSIVRGTTSKEIVQMARNAGANKVVLASCSPPIRYVPFSIYI